MDHFLCISLFRYEIDHHDGAATGLRAIFVCVIAPTLDKDCDLEHTTLKR